MNFLDTLEQRNAAFAASSFSPELKIIPSSKAFILGCVDPRVDPMDVLALEPGEAAIIRNVGGRVNSGLNEIMSLLNTVSRANGEPIGEGWHFIVLHHTQCGIRGCRKHAPALLADYMDVPESGLEALAIDDPYASVAVDVAALRAHPSLADALTVTGIVYDVETGLIKTVVPAGPLRP